MKVLYKYILTVLAIIGLLLSSSCDNAIYDRCVMDDSDVYMTFQISFNSDNSTTRAQGDSPSINSDVTDWEDYVSKLAVLVFETDANGGAKVAEEYTSTSFFIMKLKVGTYDFYFIANYPDADENNIKTKSKSEIETYLKTATEFKSFQGAKTPNPLFPMARVYRNQVVEAGGTYSNPAPFKPVVGNETDKQLKPISLYGKDHNGTTIQDNVNLIRANAKIELKINGNGRASISKIEYVNAAKNYTFSQLPEASLPSQTLLTTPLEFAFTKPVTADFTTRIYVPERLFAASEDKGWNYIANTTDEPVGKVNYIQITMNSGKIYKIPIVFNGPKIGEGNYLEFARGNGANYDIVRNYIYQYEITVPDDFWISVDAEVLPWIKRSQDFILF